MLVEDTLTLVDVRVLTPVGRPTKVQVRWETGDNAGEEYVSIRQESATFSGDELDARLNAADQGGAGSPIERLHEAVFALLEDAGKLPDGER